jgi:hypothetical protein
MCRIKHRLDSRMQFYSMWAMKLQGFVFLEYIDGDRAASGLVSRVPGYRSEVRVRFPRATRFSEVVGLGRGPLSLVSTIEELLGRESSGSSLESREYGRRDPSR